MLGIHPATLRRWEASGRVVTDRTPGGHRRYDLQTLMALAGKRSDESDRSRVTVGYARVSSHDQKDDLERQCQVLASFCATKGWPFELIRDLGSGMNYDNKGLKQLLKRICTGQVDRLVLTHKDRLLRFGAELVFSLCEQFGTEVVSVFQPLRHQPQRMAADVVRGSLEPVGDASHRIQITRRRLQLRQVDPRRAHQGLHQFRAKLQCDRRDSQAD